MKRPDSAPSAAASVGERIDQVVEQAKPHLRGWLHVGMVPVSLVLSLVLALLVPTTSGRVAAAVFGVTAVLLFATSATYHRGRWSPRVAGVLKRMDHANIFLIIAGTYTPFAVLLLPDGQQRTLLWVVWAGAVAGVVFRVFWVRAPRWLYTVVYVALGWVAVFYLVPFWRTGGPAVVVLMMLGGIMYTVGAVVYGLKRPNPSPRWFGFHEVFHAFTVAGFSSHWAAVLVAVLGVRAAIA
ncbi:PAQR family membrane homeostasis protein TrhA [Ornithinimicrobium tianjinense]|uniref:DNA-binding protein n=1 Tax=Ornithinimicrobium tianjinense TaxID=1195761 RepID=A0A917F0T1_9MICO|nr:hemolysin III family protein [Ornithinimicrobium tianjinense]GGF39092.1 DNA-binding protein [Ornithinimicrobium tianjinense]